MTRRIKDNKMKAKKGLEGRRKYYKRRKVKKRSERWRKGVEGKVKKWLKRKREENVGGMGRKG